MAASADDASAGTRAEAPEDVPRTSVRQVAIPDDLFRLIRLKAAIAGQDVDAWVVDLIRQHDDDNPQPIQPLLVEGASVQRQLTAGGPEPTAQNNHAEVLEPDYADTESGETGDRPEETPEEELDDTTLVLRTVRDSTLLTDSDGHVGATDLLHLMNRVHDWSISPTGHGRLKAAMGAAKPALVSRKESIGGKQVNAYNTGRLQKAIDKLD